MNVKRIHAVLVASALVMSCASIKRVAVNQVANALAGSGTSFSSDDDPELVGAALPFSLKLMESLLAESPKNQRLLVATSRAFAQYAYGWVESSDTDGGDANARHERAKKLYLRSRDYGIRALELSIDNFRVRLASDPHAAMRLAKRRDAEALYWTATAWGLAIGSSKDDLELLGDLQTVEALIERASELDPEDRDGAIQSFLMTYEASRAGVSKESATKARQHLEKAIEKSGGVSAGVFVAAAEALSIPAQDRTEFDSFLNRALSIDASARPGWRLQNILAQRRATWLLAHADDYFVGEITKEGQP